MAIRRRNAGILAGTLVKCPALRVTAPPEGIGHSHYNYYVFVLPERLKAEQSRERIMAAINEKGVPCFAGICGEIYLERAFPEEWRPRERRRVARELGETSLMLVVHPTLSVEDMRYMGRMVEKVVTGATR